jgi:hypothetical protein
MKICNTQRQKENYRSGKILLTLNPMIVGFEPRPLSSILKNTVFRKLDFFRPQMSRSEPFRIYLKPDDYKILYFYCTNLYRPVNINCSIKTSCLSFQIDDSKMGYRSIDSG